MNCTNCGTNNELGAKYCIKCGNPLANVANNVELLDTDVSKDVIVAKEQEPVLVTTPINNENVKQENANVAQNIDSLQSSGSEQVQNSSLVEPAKTGSEALQVKQDIKSEKVVTAKFNYINYLISVFLRPKQAYAEEESKLNEPKNSILLTLIISIVMTVLGFMRTILFTVRVAQYDFVDGGYSYSWQWANLKGIKFIQIIGKNFFVDFSIILAIAGAFYLGGLIIKKQTNFIKNMSITASSMVPVVVGAMFLAPIVDLIWSPISTIFTVIGFTYSFLIFYELMNDYFELNGEKKIWFNLACISVLLIVIYYFFIKTLTSSI